jgi:alpha-N-arabinofuranosidase
MKLSFIPLLLLLTLPTLAATIPNPSFEDVAGGKPKNWVRSQWQGKAVHEVSDVARTGKRSIMVGSGGAPVDAAWSINLSTKPWTRYRIEAWVRTEDVKPGTGQGALLNLHGRREVRSEAVTGTADWTRVTLDFDSGWDTSVQLNCLLGWFGNSSGKAWFDDLAISVLGRSEPAESKPGRIAIDLDQRAEPIPEMIYAQFIEHLGRCIYGGIWAELLEDRKFYHAVGENGGPWKTFGDGVAVTMATEKSLLLAGDQTPVLTGDNESSYGGIAQAGIGVRKGRRYVGYARLKILKPLDTPASVSLVATATGEKLAEARITAPAGAGFARVDFELAPNTDCDDATLRWALDDAGSVAIGCLSLMPADNIDGMRDDTLALLKDLNAPAYRWPGGNFVSGYDWRDGIGERDRRPPRKNPAWRGVEHNDFGMHEFIRFCRAVDTEPVIAVNTGFGDAYSCAAQLEYANGSTDTPMGKLRATNGDPKPWDVRQWCIGNEMWGAWQLGYMKREHYELKQNWVVDIMRQVDPDIHEIASGNMGDWSRGLMTNCAGHMDAISEHFYCQERPNLVAHARQMTDRIRERAEFHRQLREEMPHLQGRDIRIAMDEWNYWYGPHVFGELGTRYFLKDAVGVAAGLHEFARHTDIIESAFYAQTVNVIGCIKTTDTDAAFATTGLVLKLYREHFLGTPVATESGEALDAQAAISEDGTILVLGVANLLPRDATVPVSLAGGKLRGGARVHRITGPEEKSYNEPGAEPRVRITEEQVDRLGSSLKLPPHSVSLYLLDLK